MDTNDWEIYDELEFEKTADAAKESVQQIKELLKKDEATGNIANIAVETAVMFRALDMFFYYHHNIVDNTSNNYSYEQAMSTMNELEDTTLENGWQTINGWIHGKSAGELYAIAGLLKGIEIHLKGDYP